MLYAADTDQGKVFKIDPEAGHAQTFATSDLAGIIGLFYDELQNRLLAVFGKATHRLSESSNIGLAQGYLLVAFSKQE